MMFAIVLCLAAHAPLAGKLCPARTPMTGCNVDAIQQRNIDKQVEQLQKEITEADLFMSKADQNISNKQEAVQELATWKDNVQKYQESKERLELQNALESKQLADKIGEKKKENANLMIEIKKLQKKLQQADSEWKKLEEKDFLRDAFYKHRLDVFEKYLHTSIEQFEHWSKDVKQHSSESTELQKQLAAVNENLKTSLDALAQFSLNEDELGTLQLAKNARTAVTTKITDLVNE